MKGSCPSHQTFLSTVGVLLDVRSQSEFDAGHIEGATLVDSLGRFGTGVNEIGMPTDLAGCEYCSIAVYCRKYTALLSFSVHAVAWERNSNMSFL